MKKLFIITALVGTLGLAGYQLASANSYGPGYGGYGYCGNYGTTAFTGDKSSTGKFNDETAGIRKDLAIKQAELGALYRQDNPDPKNVAKLTGEIFDLRNGLDKIAEKYAPNRGVRGSGYAMGYGMGHDMGYGYGMMGYGGRGYGRHMMDW